MRLTNGLQGISYTGTAVLRRYDNYGKPECVVKKIEDKAMEVVKECSGIDQSVLFAQKDMNDFFPYFQNLNSQHLKYANDVFKVLALNPSDIGQIETIDFSQNYTQIIGDKGMLAVTKDSYPGDVGSVINNLI